MRVQVPPSAPHITPFHAVSGYCIKTTVHQAVKTFICILGNLNFPVLIFHELDFGDFILVTNQRKIGTGPLLKKTKAFTASIEFKNKIVPVNAPFMPDDISLRTLSSTRLSWQTIVILHLAVSPFRSVMHWTCSGKTRHATENNRFWR